MMGVTFALVFVLVFASFRSLRWTLVAVIPLAIGLLWMLGAMVLLDIKLTFYNLVVLPTVLGIGNDGGVHLTHRYREEGRGSIRRVLRSTGEHVTMGALTNLIGFGGLLLSNHPGLQSIGVLAVVGIGTTLVATLAFYPRPPPSRRGQPVAGAPPPPEASRRRRPRRPPAARVQAPRTAWEADVPVTP